MARHNLLGKLNDLINNYSEGNGKTFTIGYAGSQMKLDFIILH
jgi:hypothetical protein